MGPDTGLFGWFSGKEFVCSIEKFEYFILATE
jgi:hypothetical protein